MILKRALHGASLFIYEIRLESDSFQALSDLFKVIGDRLCVMRIGAERQHPSAHFMISLYYPIGGVRLSHIISK